MTQKTQHTREQTEIFFTYIFFQFFRVALSGMYIRMMHHRDNSSLMVVLRPRHLLLAMIRAVVQLQQPNEPVVLP